MANLSTLVDDFNDNSIGAAWPLSYGGASEAGGRAVVPCSSVNYAGYQTGTIWTFDSFFVEIPTFPALAGATVECYTSAWIFSAGQDAGTHVGFLGDHTTGNLYFMSRVGYVDAGALSVTLSPTTHRWWRLRITGGNLLWDTSTDGQTWTNRRSLATPAWLAASPSDCKLLLESHRNDGTNNVSEFDNVNVPAFSTVSATGAASLGGLTAAATGLRTVLATDTAALGGLTATATGLRTVVATDVASLGALTAATTSVRQVDAVNAAALGGLTATATGSRATAAVTAALLGDLTATALAVRLTPGTATIALGGLIAAAVARDRITSRPDAGTTPRPNGGVTTRPYAGVTARP